MRNLLGLQLPLYLFGNLRMFPTFLICHSWSVNAHTLVITLTLSPCFACPYLLPPDPIPSWQLEAVELQNAELLAAAHEAEQERTRLRDELKAAVDKVGQ